MPGQLNVLGENVYGEIMDLEFIDLVSLVGDICQIRGWQASIEVGNPETAGDILATQEFPFPQSIAIVCHEGDLPREQLVDYFEMYERRPEDRLTVIRRGEASGAALAFADSHGVALFDAVDLTEELLSMSATDLLAEYTDSFDAPERRGRTDEANKQASVGEEFGTVPNSGTSESVTATVLAVVDLVDVSSILYPHLNDAEHVFQTVVLWEVQNDGGETIEYGNDYITYLFADGMQSKVSDHIIDEQSLDSLWEPAPGPDEIPRIEPHSKVRWVSLLDHVDDKTLDAAVLRGARGKHEDIRIPLSDAMDASKDVLPFNV